MTKKNVWPHWKDFFESGSIISRSKDEFLIGWGPKSQGELNPDADPLFYFPNFFLNKPNAWYKHESNETFTLEELLNLFESVPVETVPPFTWNNTYEQFYAEQFEVLQKLFADKTLDKAVPFVYDKTLTQMTPSILYHCLKSALNYISSNSTYLMGFWDNGMGALSISPELLFEIKTQENGAGKIYTMALGGTFFSPDVKMLQNERLVHEHQIIVDRIVKNLSPFGTVHTGQVEAIPFAKIYHLLTKISVDFDSENTPDFMSIVKAMHPTPALGASPPEEGMKWLKYYQTLIDRFCFGAPAGYQWKAKNESKCYVNIRNIHWTKGHILVAAGGGVTAKSDLNSEWTEIKNKMKSIKSIFRIS